MHSRNQQMSPSDELMQTMDRIYRSRMTTTSGGNLSIRDEDGSIWVTPSRIDKGRLTRESMVCVRRDGSNEGPHAPSSELPFHRAIYSVRSDVNAVVHAHSRGLQAFSIVGKVPDTRICNEAYELCGPGGFANYALPGSEALGREIARVFAEGHNCVILENHAVVVGGRTMREAFERLEMFEFTAMAILRAKGLGELQLLNTTRHDSPSPIQPALEEFDPSEWPHAEREARDLLVDFVHRGYEQKLLTATLGALSTRLDRTSVLTTPHHFDRGQCVPEDLVLIADRAQERGKLPNSMILHHLAIFDRHPDIGAIVSASPVNTMALSITDASCDSSIIPESFVLLRSVQRVPFDAQDTNIDQLAAQISLRTPVAILQNGGSVVAGTDLLDAFGRLEVLEATVETIIDGSRLGNVSPIEPRRLKELCDALSIQ
jgi:L-fuculose-phosphate aldolase